MFTGQKKKGSLISMRRIEWKELAKNFDLEGMTLCWTDEKKFCGIITTVRVEHKSVIFCLIQTKKMVGDNWQSYQDVLDIVFNRRNWPVVDDQKVTFEPRRMAEILFEQPEKVAVAN